MYLFYNRLNKIKSRHKHPLQLPRNRHSINNRLCCIRRHSQIHDPTHKRSHRRAHPVHKVVFKPPCSSQQTKAASRVHGFTSRQRGEARWKGLYQYSPAPVNPGFTIAVIKMQIPSVRPITIGPRTRPKTFDCRGSRPAMNAIQRRTIHAINSRMRACRGFISASGFQVQPGIIVCIDVVSIFIAS